MLETEDIAIVADDLTGACDVAACFASKLGTVEVNLSADWRSAGGQTLRVLNTQSRLEDSASARSFLHQVGSFLSSKRVIFKKIDAGLRGPVGAELAGLLDGLNDSGKQWTCVVAPAAPSIGRTTRNGVQYDCGIPIDQGALSNDPDSPPPSSNIRLTVQQTGGGDYLVADAQSPEDVERIIDTHLAKGHVVFAGSLGLALALANQLKGIPRSLEMGPPARHPLFICGSRHPHSAFQLERARREGIRTLDFEPACLRFREPIETDGNGPLLIRILPGDTLSSAYLPTKILASFIDALCSLLEKIKPDGLGIIGGETAYHVLHRLGAQRLEVFERQAEVIACSRIGEGVMNGCRFVCKGGSVGPNDAVLQMLSLLTNRRG